MTSIKQFTESAEALPPTQLSPHPSSPRPSWKKQRRIGNHLILPFSCQPSVFAKESSPKPNHRAQKVEAASCSWRWPCSGRPTPPPRCMNICACVSFKATQDFGTLSGLTLIFLMPSCKRPLFLVSKIHS